MRRAVPRVRHDILALVVLVLAVSLFHASGLRPGRTFLPVDLANNNLPWRDGSSGALQNWLISDPLYEYYPLLVNSVETIRHTGQWPLWNPRILLGHPVLADPLAQVFYPVFIVLGLVLGAARGLAIGLWLHAILAAVLTYGFLRTIGCHWRAAILGALTYALSGYLVTWFETLFFTSTLAWLPGILWAFELAVQRRRWRYVALGALMTALAVLGGQVAFVVTFSLFLFLYACGRTWELSRQAGRLSAWPLMASAMILVTGFLLSAIQAVPFAEFLGLSQRVLERGLANPLPWRQLVTLIVPNFYGNPATGGPYWGALNFSEGTIYAGLVSLLLACLAPFSSRRMFTPYVSVIGLLTVYFIIGGPGVSSLGGLPVIKYVTQHRITFLLPLIVALLAARTLSAPKVPAGAAIAVSVALMTVACLAARLNWGRAQEHWRQIQGSVVKAALLLAIAVVLLVLRGLFPRIQHVTDWGLIVLVFVDLYLYGSHFNPTGPIAKLMPVTPGIEYLRANGVNDRILVYQRDNNILLGPNIPSIYGIAEAGGSSSLVPARFRQIIVADDPKPDIGWMTRDSMMAFSFPSRRLLDLLQVRYLVSQESFTDPGVRAEAVNVACDNDSGEISETHAMSGTFTVHDTAINRLDLRFRNTRPEPGKGALLIRMWRAGDPDHPVLEARPNVADLQDGKLTLYFSPQREAPGQTYTWKVSAERATAPTGEALCLSADGKPAVSIYGADGTQVYSGEMYIFERLSPLPRAYVVYAAEQVPDDALAVNRLLDKSFDLRNVAVTAAKVDLPNRAPIPASRAAITSYQDTRVEIRASAKQPGLLILADQYHPGWQAYLDGRPARIIRVNQILRGVELPPGEHEIIFSFAPASLRIGIGISLVGLMVLIVMLTLDWLPSRKRHKAE